jgi:GT2 family glycosyltransferase
MNMSFMNYPVAPASVVIPTWQRLSALQKTLAVLDQADPQPTEILVHVDAGDDAPLPYCVVSCDSRF